VVDENASTVSVIDPLLGAIVRSTRVGGLPHGIAFTDTGDRAYVTCSGVDRVDVISAASGLVVKSIPIPARDPRGIVWQNGRAWLVSFTSGNNTAPVGAPGNPGKVIGVRRISGAGLTPLPDRDLFSIVTQANPALDALDPAATRTGLGTTLFNVCPRPGTNELWIPNTEALNADHKGEKNFVAGQVVSNRISVVDTSNNLPPVVIDLDALAPAGVKCAQPTSVTFDPSGTRAYVTGFGSDLLAVLELQPGAPPAWAGVVTLPSKQAYPRGSGPRASLVGPSGTLLFVYERVDTSVSVIDLAALPAGGGFNISAGLPFALGFEASTGLDRLGRHLFTNANFSKSLTSSCASCHIDAHTDGLAWDLGAFLDPEGTPDSQLAYPIDPKGPLVTQSTRRMADQMPYHWRGEKHSLDDFQAAFIGLLENQVAGQPADIGADFHYLHEYLDRLNYPPNPRASPDRRYSPLALAGANVFLQKQVLGSLTCNSCHQLPVGTGGDLVAEVADGMIRSADVPALRGVGDKGAKPFWIGGDFGRRTELGAGWMHGGSAPTLRDAVQKIDPQTGLPRFNLSTLEVDQLVAFLEEFDTGLAPSTGMLATANPANAATFRNGTLRFLEAQARSGQCDLVFYRSPGSTASGVPVQIRGRFDPLSGKYQPALRAAPQVSADFLIAEAAAGRPVTFVGLPLGMGYTFGLDRDCDGLWDLDEQRKGTDPDDWDSDGDGFPDGYEVDWGMNPLVSSPSSPDTTAPALAAPAQLTWASTNTLKFEFDTTEMAKVSLAYNGGYPVQRLPLAPVEFDTHHDVLLNGLTPNTSIQITLILKDPAGNTRTDTSTVFQTRARVLGEPAAVGQITLTVVPGMPANQLQADVALVSGGVPAGAGYAVQGALYQVDFGGTLALLADNLQAQTGASGTATLSAVLPAPQAPPGTLLFVVRDVQAPAGSPPYVLALDAALTAGVGY
jgi:DNA-binding beta-propeller fold protein YncE